VFNDGLTLTSCRVPAATLSLSGAGGHQAYESLTNMTSTVWASSDGYEWDFAGEFRRQNGAGDLVIKHADLTACMATDLARVLRRLKARDVMPDEVLVDVAPDDEYDPKYTAVESVSILLLDDGRLGARCYFSSQEEYASSGSQPDPRALRLVASLLHRSGAELVNLVRNDERASPPYYYCFDLAVSTRSKSLVDVYRVAEDASALFEAASMGQITRDAVVDLVAGGRADLLCGQPEGPWLDVKSAHYDLTTPKGKISLAQAVSRFANAEEGGIVVVGMSTKRIRGGELIDSIKPVPVDTATVRRYRQAIETCLFPFPVGLEIRPVETSPGEGLILVSLPSQEEELKPFLVHGAIVGDRVEGAYISIVRRSGEDSIPITAQQIHSTLAAGRALLRRGYIQGE
jgi:hypothetical protein